MQDRRRQTQRDSSASMAESIYLPTLRYLNTSQHLRAGNPCPQETNADTHHLGMAAVLSLFSPHLLTRSLRQCTSPTCNHRRLLYIQSHCTAPYYRCRGFDPIIRSSDYIQNPTRMFPCQAGWPAHIAYKGERQLHLVTTSP